MVRGERDGRTYIIHVTDTGAPLLFGALAVLAAGWAAYQAFAFPNFAAREQFQGSVAAVLLFGGAFVLLFERGAYVLDAAAGELRWWRRRVTGLRRGVVPLVDVTAIRTELSIGSRRVPMRRIVIDTVVGPMPVSRAFAADSPGDLLAVANAAREFTGLPGTPERVALSGR